MYMTGQKPLTVQRKQQSKRERTPVGIEERHSVAAGLSYEDVRIRYNSQIPLQRRAADHKQKASLENDRRTETGADRMANYSSEPDLTEKMDEQSGVIQRSPVPLDTIMTLFQSGMKISAVAAAVGLPLYIVYKLIRRCMLQKEGQDVPAALRIAEEDEKSEEEERAPQGEELIREEIIEIKDKEESEEKEESKGEERASQKEESIQEEEESEGEERAPQEEEESEGEERVSQKEVLKARFDRLVAQINETYSEEDINSINPPSAIKIWRQLRHKTNNLTETELAELENAMPRKKVSKKKDSEMPLEPQPVEEEEEEDPRDAIAREWLGPLDQHTYRNQTSCAKGSMLAAYLIEKGIITSENEVTIGHQSGRSAEDKRFVAIIRGKKYLIFMAQHPREDFKEYEVSECYITQGMGYRINLEGKRIRIGNKGFELNDGKTLV